ncbi:MAG: T9SS C-terminal target domain-containing protein, partial [Chitinophagia bacterium]|nr:T9SS C-terminal target domain-containing protein [Chitinophagia bacterium]
QFNSAGYLSLPVADYIIDVTNSTGSTVVKRYSAPLSTLSLRDSAITVLASGFLDSTVNSNGRKFGLWVALRTGGALIPLPEVSTTAVSDVALNDAVGVYPNPATATLNVTTGNVRQQSIAVLDFTGRVMNEVANTANATFTTANWPTGMYIVKATDETGKVLITKVVKQ